VLTLAWGVTTEGRGDDGVSGREGKVDGREGVVEGRREDVVLAVLVRVPSPETMVEGRPKP